MCYLSRMILKLQKKDDENPQEEKLSEENKIDLNKSENE